MQTYRLLPTTIGSLDDQRSGGPMKTNSWGFLQNLGHPSRRRWLIFGLFLSALTLFWTWTSSGEDLRRLSTHAATSSTYLEDDMPVKPEVTLLVASMKADNTSWLDGYRPEWDKKIYVTDDKSAPLTVPLNKGREAMVYLTYIIDHYDELAPVTIFSHANRYQWHNDDPLYDGQRMLDRLQVNYILDQGYVNLRCVWVLGCPSEIHPVEDQRASYSDDDEDTGSHYAKAFAELFPMLPMPKTVGVACCAQFAASRTKIRERPLADYQGFREWLLNTDLRDHISGRILEYSWHMVFGEDAVFCPDVETCYCKVYGLCSLSCESGGCKTPHGPQYTLPPYSNLPHGWPEVGWRGETRNITKMRQEQALDYAPI